ncbi:MAG: phBC6A51 family helix-turn-helix protein [bacterium]|nr:phBC6A51 family helix-turn-helix protein [bacterium]
MNISEKHYSAIQLLVLHQFDGLTQAQLAEKIGVTRRTVQNWLQDPGFVAELRAAKSKWRRKIEHIPFIHRRKRLEELQRLYEAIPDSSISAIVESKDGFVDPETGKPSRAEDEKLVTAMAVRRMHVNEKAKILEQMAQEVGGDVLEELEELKKELRDKLKIVAREG